MKIGIIGLGYVGLPLLIEFSKKYDVVGYDKNQLRLSDLRNNKDSNNELKKYQFTLLKNIQLTNKIQNLKQCNIYIVTVPTPVGINNKPDLDPLKQACLDISKLLKLNDIVIFESTVFPGLTEDYCVQWLKKNNDLKYNIDFFCGYSPERINPGDQKKTLTNIIKITSGSNKSTANTVNKLYKSIIKAGTYKAPSIKIAEAAKVIENCQRDVNIAFVNELNNIFEKMNLNTNEILKAASSKWNFLNFKPGLVGGHCVSIDPYYLIHSSIKHNYIPKMLLTARKINENVTRNIASNVKKLTKNKKNINIVIFGFSFKQNCNDIRNTKIFDLYNLLKKKYSIVDIYDPLVDKNAVKKIYNIKMINNLKKDYYDLAIMAVKHDIFKIFTKINLTKSLKGEKIIYDYIELFNRS